MSKNLRKDINKNTTITCIVIIIVCLITIIASWVYIATTYFGFGLSNDPQNPQGSSSNSISSNQSSSSNIENPVKKNDKQISDDYFDNVTFVGDSLTWGINAYGILQNTTVIAEKGLSVDTVMTKKCIENKDGTFTTVANAVKANESDKIYIMLGTNGFVYMDLEQFIEKYEEFIKEIKRQNPKSKIIIQSILPVCDYKTEEDSRYSNKKIDQFNEAILEMCNKLKVHYINVAEVFKDKNGNMDREYSSDGMHLNKSAYKVWIDYLKTHTID